MVIVNYIIPINKCLICATYLIWLINNYFNSYLELLKQLAVFIYINNEVFIIIVINILKCKH